MLAIHGPAPESWAQGAADTQCGRRNPQADQDCVLNPAANQAVALALVEQACCSYSASHSVSQERERCMSSIVPREFLIEFSIGYQIEVLYELELALAENAAHTALIRVSVRSTV